MKEELTLLDIWSWLVRRKKVIILVSIGGMILFFGYKLTDSFKESRFSTIYGEIIVINSGKLGRNSLLGNYFWEILKTEYKKSSVRVEISTKFDKACNVWVCDLRALSKADLMRAHEILMKFFSILKEEVKKKFGKSRFQQETFLFSPDEFLYLQMPSILIYYNYTLPKEKVKLTCRKIVSWLLVSFIISGVFAISIVALVEVFVNYGKAFKRHLRGK